MSSARIIHGDNLVVMRDLHAEGLRAHLIYADPPFATGRDFFFERKGKKELAYSDKWATFDAYLEALRLRMVAARDLLTDDGCMVVHVDPTASHYVKVMMDGIFGRDCFASEIVWRYRKWPSGTANFQGVHDVLLRYVRDAKKPPRWEQLYEPLAPSTVKTWGSGHKQRAVSVGGKRVGSSTDGGEASLGCPMGDVWDDIGILAPSGHERTGYPTQKPERLVERVIRSCSHRGDTVLDPYVGSGTTLRAARRLARFGVGIDVSEVAVRVTRETLDQPAMQELF